MRLVSAGGLAFNDMPDTSWAGLMGKQEGGNSQNTHLCINRSILGTGLNEADEIYKMLTHVVFT